MPYPDTLLPDSHEAVHQQASLRPDDTSSWTRYYAPAFRAPRGAEWRIRRVDR